MSRAITVRSGASSSNPSNDLPRPAVRKALDRQRCEAGQMTNAIPKRKLGMVDRMCIQRGAGKECQARWTSTLKRPVRTRSQGRVSDGREQKTTITRVAASEDTTQSAAQSETDAAAALAAPIGPADPNDRSDRSDPGSATRVQTTALPTTNGVTANAATPTGARATASRSTSRAHASGLPLHHQHRHRPKCANGILANNATTSTQVYPSACTHTDKNECNAFVCDTTKCE